jgi:hypothetical protein
MIRKTLYATAAGAFLFGSAGISSGAQELVCDRQPTSTTAASCMYMPERISSQPASGTHFVVEPAGSERLIVREPIPSERVVVREPIPRERVVLREPVTGTPVEPIAMRYEADNPFPFPSPTVGEVQTRVYIPTEPHAVQSGPSIPRGVPTD